MVQVWWLCGPPGVGKTTVGWELYARLAARGAAVAYVDIDQLGMSYPEHPADAGRFRLKAANLDAAVRGFAAAGARRVIVSGVVDSRHGVAPGHDGFPDFALRLVRLRATEATLRARYRGRGVRPWELSRVLAEAAELDRHAIGDHRVDTDGLSVSAVVERVEALLDTCTAESPIEAPPAGEPHRGQSVVRPHRLDAFPAGTPPHAAAPRSPRDTPSAVPPPNPLPRTAETPGSTSGPGTAAPVEATRIDQDRPVPGAEPHDGTGDHVSTIEAGEVLWLCGVTASGKSGVGWELYRRLLRDGVPSAFLDLEQLGFQQPSRDAHPLRARNAAAAWQRFRRCGARRLVMVGPIDDPCDVAGYRHALAPSPVTLCRLDAGPAALARRVQRRAAGEGVQLPGDGLRGLAPAARNELAQEAARLARRLRDTGIGDLAVDTDDRTISEVADAVLASLDGNGRFGRAE